MSSLKFYTRVNFNIAIINLKIIYNFFKYDRRDTWGLYNMLTLHIYDRSFHNLLTWRYTSRYFPSWRWQFKEHLHLNACYLLTIVIRHLRAFNIKSEISKQDSAFGCTLVSSGICLHVFTVDDSRPGTSLNAESRDHQGFLDLARTLLRALWVAPGVSAWLRPQRYRSVVRHGSTANRQPSTRALSLSASLRLAVTCTCNTARAASFCVCARKRARARVPPRRRRKSNSLAMDTC